MTKMNLRSMMVTHKNQMRPKSRNRSIASPSEKFISPIDCSRLDRSIDEIIPSFLIPSFNQSYGSSSKTLFYEGKEKVKTKFSSDLVLRSNFNRVSAFRINRRSQSSTSSINLIPSESLLSDENLKEQQQEEEEEEIIKQRVQSVVLEREAIENETDHSLEEGQTVLNLIRSLPESLRNHQRSNSNQKLFDFNLFQKNLCQFVLTRLSSDSSDASRLLLIELVKVSLKINDKFFNRRVIKLIKTLKEKRNESSPSKSIGVESLFWAEDLIEFWKISVDLKNPSRDWNYWLSSTLIEISEREEESFSRVIDRAYLQDLTRFLGFSIGILIQSEKRNSSTPTPEKRFESLNKYLQMILKWEKFVQESNKIENYSGSSRYRIFFEGLNQRKIQINQIILADSSNNEKIDYWDVVRSDPYTFSTVLRNSNDVPGIESIHKNLELNDHQEILRLTRVICRSKGHLIGPSSSSNLIEETGIRPRYELMSEESIESLLNSKDYHNFPSIKRTGLLLSLAESLVGKIRLMITNRSKTEKIMIELDRLFSISLNSNDRLNTIYGGRFESNKLLRRKRDGFELVIDHLLESSLFDQNLFSVLFYLIESVLNRFEKRSQSIIGIRTWKKINHRFLNQNFIRNDGDDESFCYSGDDCHCSCYWNGPIGLKRLLENLLKFSTLVKNYNLSPSASNEENEGDEDDFFEKSGSLKFSNFFPIDLGLTLIDRIIFPKELLECLQNLNRFIKNQPRQDNSNSDRIDDGFSEEKGFSDLVERLKLLQKLIKSLGNPRRFRDRRLMRLIYLNFRNRRIDLIRSNSNYSIFNEDYSFSSSNCWPGSIENDSELFENGNKKGMKVVDGNGNEILSYRGCQDEFWWNFDKVWFELESRLVNNSDGGGSNFNENHETPGLKDFNYQDQIEFNWNRAEEKVMGEDENFNRKSLNEDEEKKVREEKSNGSREVELKHQLDELNEDLRVRSKDYFKNHSIVCCSIELLKDWIWNNNNNNRDMDKKIVKKKK